MERITQRIDPKAIVRDGYNACADVYAPRRAEDDADQIIPLLGVLPEGSAVLDLGCGAGVPIARALSERYRVTGVDISEAMVRLAEVNVPEARFELGDVSGLVLAENAYDAVVAIFMLFHLPRDEHGRLFERVWAWLRPGGYFLVSLTKDRTEPYIKHDFFGNDMYWSKLSFSDTMELLEGVGFEIVRERILGHGYGEQYVEKDEQHPLTLVRKPPAATAAPTPNEASNVV